MNIDATVVQIIPEDNISNDYFLELESEYLNKNKFNSLINEDIFIPQFPGNEGLSYSQGKIKFVKKKL